MTDNNHDSNKGQVVSSVRKTRRTIGKRLKTADEWHVSLRATLERGTADTLIKRMNHGLVVCIDKNGGWRWYVGWRGS
jgi:hypothetical protein